MTPQPSVWYDPQTYAERPDSINAWVRYDNRVTLEEIGCFLSTNRDSVVEAQRISDAVYSNGCLLARDIGSFNHETYDSNYNKTQAYYPANEFDEFGSLASFSPGVTYYNKFYAITSDGRIVHSEIYEYTPPLGDNVIVEISSSAGGSISLGTSGTYPPNTQIQLQAAPMPNWLFSHWVSSNGGTFSDPYSATTIFTVPESSTTITAYFRSESGLSLNITPASIDFGTLYAGYLRTFARTVTIQNISGQSISLNGLVSDSNFSIEILGKDTLTPGEETKISIAPVLGLPVGTYEPTIELAEKSTPLTLSLTVHDDPYPISSHIPCKFCGYEDAVITNMLYGGDGWTDNGDGTHSGMFKPLKWAYCSICVAGFDVEFAPIALHTRVHEFSDGYCTYCGATNKSCYHDSANYKLTGEDLILHTPLYENELFHAQAYTVYEIYTCAECGGTYTDTNEMDSLDAHHFDSSGLCLCGASGEPTTCIHENLEWIDYIALITQFELVSDEYHLKFEDTGYGSWCTDCDKPIVFYLTDRNKKTTELHSYQNGYCTGCDRYYLEHLNTILTLPASVKQIRQEAFFGNTAQAVIVPVGCEQIDSRAFAECAKLECIQLPSTVTAIATDAFSECTNLVICAPADSYAQQFAESHMITFIPY